MPRFSKHAYNSHAISAEGHVLLVERLRTLVPRVFSVGPHALEISLPGAVARVGRPLALIFARETMQLDRAVLHYNFRFRVSSHARMQSMVV